MVQDVSYGLKVRTSSMLSGLIEWGIRDQDRALELAELLLAVGIALLAWRCPAWLDRLDGPLIRLYERRKILVMLLISITPAAIRVAFLPVIPYPIPFIADEMSHLLIADTVANGRLTNPPHAFSDHFEATYVVQKRVYGSIYPPFHGFTMGLAQALGLHPWFGVLGGMVLLIFSICWMLDAWLPPRWVIAGALIAWMRLGFWLFNYWGGALAATGGALVAGALRRMWDRPRPVHGVVLATGLTILANTRPYEALLCGIVTAVVLMRILRCGRTFAAMAIALAIGGGFTGYYNWRVTGNALNVPNVADQREHGTPTSLIFLPHPPKPPAIERFADLNENYNWQRDTHAEARTLSWSFYSKKLKAFWHFYVHPLLVVPLAVGLILPSMRWVTAAVLFVSAGTAIYPFYFPHYSAPIAPLLILLIAEGARRLSVRTGVLFAAVSVIGVVLVAFALRFHGEFRARSLSMYPRPVLARHDLQQKLTAIGGRHLVFVRYAPDHNYHYGSTYNRADIDGAGIVFARELDPESNARLKRYFAGRTMWLFEPDTSRVLRLEPEQ
jgi:hypothetical protein